MNAIEKYEKAEIAKLTENKNIPVFRPGDTVTVNVTVIEGDKKRKQAFKGVVIARHNRSLGSTFRVRKLVGTEAVERTFHLYSPNIDIVVERHGRVRRAKLYYLRSRYGKSARIAEKVTATT